MTRYAWGVLWLAGCILGCGTSGTETQNPLATFAKSGCKKEASASQNTQSVRMARNGTASIRQALDEQALGAETAGLKCIAWETATTGIVSIWLLNFEGACGADYDGEAQIASDGSLTLGLVNRDCRQLDCGACTYDWSFGIRDLRMGAVLPLAIRIDTCPGDPNVLPGTSTTELPIDTRAEGVVCRYADYWAINELAAARSTCGQQGMPCAGGSQAQRDLGFECAQGSKTMSSPCSGGLACTQIESDDGGVAGVEQTICMRVCATEIDCGTTGALTCAGGVCLPKTPW